MIPQKSSALSVTGNDLVSALTKIGEQIAKPHFPPDENCGEFLYMNGVLITLCSDATFAQAMARSPEGRWYPIDHGYRSEDGRTLLLHRKLSRPPLTEIAKRMQAETV